MSWLFDGSCFLTRDHCGFWEPWLAIVYQAANLAAAMAFLFIPAILLGFWAQRRAVLPRPSTPLLFAAFILPCGLGHLGAGLAFVWAPYRLFALVDALTAIAAVYAAARLPGLARYYLTLPTPEEHLRVREALARRNRVLAEARERSDERNRELRERIAELEQLTQTNIWLLERDEALQQLKQMLVTIGEDDRGT